MIEADARRRSCTWIAAVDRPVQTKIGIDAGKFALVDIIAVLILLEIAAEGQRQVGMNVEPERRMDVDRVEIAEQKLGAAGEGMVLGIGGEREPDGPADAGV